MWMDVQCSIKIEIFDRVPIVPLTFAHAVFLLLCVVLNASGR